ncbi:phosphoribosylamine--glycine ligase [Candidatus Magnetoovum chiemensis]|nr:phosphoribosylamine--glycine ligase [Candidatus Magnetoovum chiemensis]
MKILVIGAGGREHAIVWSLLKSHHIEQVYCCPGNGGISDTANCIDISPDNHAGLLDFIKYEWIDLTVVGPEAPLALGIVDAFNKAGRKIIGPNRAAAMLEASKVFAKDFMKKYNLPTADYKAFTFYRHVEEHVTLRGAPIVIKADGLAGGKGVIVANTQEEANAAARLIMKEKAFGKAGDWVVVEDCLIGQEASFMVFTDGKTIVPMVSSQDHKRAYDNDEGPNTGGMGAYSPAPIITKEMEHIIMQKIMIPAIEGLKKDGIKYKGILYAGLMIVEGSPYVLEFNCRFGDPEAQAVLMRLDTPLLDIFLAINDNALDATNINWKPQHSMCVVLASGGYPGEYEKGKPITGLDNLNQEKDVAVFHSGTKYDNNTLVTSSGRVMGVTSLGHTLADAKNKAYAAIDKIHFDGMYYRKDIGSKALI